jgi:dienelactone hydrolase
MRAKVSLIGFIMAISVIMAAPVTADAAKPVPWDLRALSAVPAWKPAPDHDVERVHAIFYDGVPWKGKPTRVFAYYGIPEVRPGETVPAMVLVHGGGGSAFAPWVKLWVSRGYAAIAMDTCGCISSGGYSNHPRDPEGGPAGWGGFDQVDQPIEDQWTYHAVADVILGHSLIRTLPGIDPKRTGITGISWGGYLTCIVAGIDPRFRFASPVYGCGYLGDNSAWLPNFEQMGSERARKWLSLWDPSVYLPRARMPMLWVDGTNDFAYPLDSVQKSYRLPRGRRTLATRVRMPHGHGGPGENPEEIHAIADSVLRKGVPLAAITGSGRDGQTAWAAFSGKASIVRAELNYTTDSGRWQDRLWHTAAASLDTGKHRASVMLPAGTTVYYLNLFDSRDLVVSSEHEEIAPAPK